MSKKTRRAPATPRRRPENEGEGSRSAARRYNAGVARSVANGTIDQAAKDAERALDTAERFELAEAEEAGKNGHATNGHDAIAETTRRLRDLSWRLLCAWRAFRHPEERPTRA